MHIHTKKLTAAAVGLVSSASALYISGNVTAPCDSPIYCHGDLLKEIELAQPFSDSKTFVDMPALKPLSSIQSAFDQLSKPLSNNTALHTFLSENFGPAGGELASLPPSSLTTNATFLSSVSDPVLRDFTEAVINIWPDLTRQYVNNATNDSLPTSFLPVSRPFVIAGGRFREPYYWDTLWIVEGLLRSGGSFIGLARNAIENFLDFIETYGFVPNGARLYYLNRSQPPVLALIVATYIQHTNDSSILTRALPLLEIEYDFWMTNRSVSIPVYGGDDVALNVYRVANTQPRPESFREDHLTASEANVSDPSSLYANLASGAESGWDFSAGRWLADPTDAVENRTAPLKTLNTVNIVPVDLNSILFGVELSLSNFHILSNNASAANLWKQRAEARSAAMHSLLWNETHFAYFDYNLTSSSQNLFVPLDKTDATNSTASVLFRVHAPQGYKRLHTISSYFPFWTGAALPSLRRNASSILKAFKPISTLLDSYPGGISATNVASGQQWDFPNVWPPHMHVLMASLENSAPAPSVGPGGAASFNGVKGLSQRLAQRYVDSAYCTWWATGGSTASTPRYPGAEEGANGIMFEKYSAERVDGAGSGGEYEVVKGFGWTNGVLIWTVETFAETLKAPVCDIDSKVKRGVQGKKAVEIHQWDAQWIKMFGRE